jgi:hypothetical protein
MLDLNPPCHIYEPFFFSADELKPLIIGGVKITPPYKSSNLTTEMYKVLDDITNSLRQAYEANMRISIPSSNIISTEISPLTVPIKKNCKDYLIGNYPEKNEKLAEILLQRLMIERKDTELFTHKKGFYVAHKLEEKFNPEATEVLIKRVKRAILTLTYKFTLNRFMIKSSIHNKILRVDAEIIPIDTLYIV